MVRGDEDVILLAVVNGIDAMDHMKGKGVRRPQCDHESSFRAGAPSSPSSPAQALTASHGCGLRLHHHDRGLPGQAAVNRLIKTMWRGRRTEPSDR